MLTRLVREVFEVLAAEGQGRFLAVNGSRARSYVAARALAEAVLLAGSEDVDRLRGVIERPLSDVLVELAPQAMVHRRPNVRCGYDGAQVV